jgi:hypothetical protein
MKTYALLLALLALVGCTPEKKLADNPQTAKGETPIRFVICNAGGSGCFVASRFASFDSCEAHKEWSDMQCDRTSPGRMDCHARVSEISATYCTQ